MNKCNNFKSGYRVENESNAPPRSQKNWSEMAYKNRSITFFYLLIINWNIFVHFLKSRTKLWLRPLYIYHSIHNYYRNYCTIFIWKPFEQIVYYFKIFWILLIIRSLLKNRTRSCSQKGGALYTFVQLYQLFLSEYII